MRRVGDVRNLKAVVQLWTPCTRPAPSLWWFGFFPSVSLCSSSQRLQLASSSITWDGLAISAKSWLRTLTLNPRDKGERRRPIIFMLRSILSHLPHNRRLRLTMSRCISDSAVAFTPTTLGQPRCPLAALSTDDQTSRPRQQERNRTTKCLYWPAQLRRAATNTRSAEQ